MIGFWCVTGGFVLLAFVIFPMGFAPSSGTRYHDRKPLTWAAWRDEAQTALCVLNPLRAFQDARDGYESFSGAAIMLLVSLVTLASIGVGLVLVGFGCWVIWAGL